MSRHSFLKTAVHVNIIMEKEIRDYFEKHNINLSEFVRYHTYVVVNGEIPMEEFKKVEKKNRYDIADEIIKTAVPSAKYAEIKTEIIKKTGFPQKRVMEYLVLQKGIGNIDVKDGLIIYKGSTIEPMPSPGNSETILKK